MCAVDAQYRALASQGATPRQVAPTGLDPDDGASSGSPCRTVQYALDVAGDGDPIKIAQGAYTGAHGRPAPPSYESPPAGGSITPVVFISKSISIRGGYTAPGSAGRPDPIAYPASPVAQGQGRVLALAGSITPSIEGLRITGGDAAGLGGSAGGRWHHALDPIAPWDGALPWAESSL